MGEIKSTLDIIMEKTKGLTMTEAEKQSFQKREIEGKVSGFLLKFLDNLMDLDRLKTEMAGLGEDKQAMAQQILKAECLSRIDPLVDNAPLIQALKYVAGIDTGPLENALSMYHKDLAEQQAKHEVAALETLRQEGISGSAVVPNLNADPAWENYVLKMKQHLREKLEALL
jgi:hypothetical protein